MSIFPSILPSYEPPVDDLEDEAEDEDDVEEATADADTLELSDVYEPDSTNEPDENGGEKA